MTKKRARAAKSTTGFVGGRLGDFCRTMGRETNQGEVGLVVGDEYFAMRDFVKE